MAQINVPIPERYNGTLTHYKLFDGFREMSTLGKIGYVIGSIIPVPFVIPIVIEMKQKSKSEEAAHAVQLSMQTAAVNAAGGVEAYAPEQAMAQFRAMEDARRAAPARDQQIG